MDRKSAIDEIQSLLRRGTPWQASDVFRAIDATGDVTDPELLYWGAMANVRSGASKMARALLDRGSRLASSASVEVRRESLCLDGRWWKDQIDRAPDGRAVDEETLRAFNAYFAAYRVDGSAYAGMNAATLAMLAGEPNRASALATEVLARLASESEVEDAWHDATVGEGLLILGRFDEAADAYSRAAVRMADDLGSAASMRRQLRLIERVVPEARAIRESLPSPVIVAFAGHMIDRRDRSSPRFPATLEPVVTRRLRDHFAQWPTAIVYASAACGADILCLEAALDAGAEINVVLPFDRDNFVGTSVAFAGDEWVARFDRVLAAATQVIAATDESYLGDDLLFEHAQRLVGGLAMLRARQLEAEPTMLFVVDPDEPGLVGGTRDELERWARRGARIEIVDLGTLRRAAPEARRAVGDVGTAPAPEPKWNDRPKRTLKALLFADMGGFSRVHDLHAPLFHKRFLQIVADCIAASLTPPLEANTWGDAFYIVFETATDAAAFALGVAERMRAVDWIEAGLSDDSGIRIALHAGPVFCGFDPIIGRDNYFGTSVTTTARMEPIVPPNVVYASEAFAATLTTEEADGFNCEYVGEVALAKQYGKTRVFRVERS